MSVAAACAVALAVAVAWGPWGAARRLRGPAAHPRRRIGSGWVVAFAGVVAGVATGGWAAGLPGAVGVGALGALALTAARLAMAERHARVAARRTDEVGRFCDGLAIELRLGAHPLAALSAAARDIADLAPLRGVERTGGDAAGALLGLAGRPGYAGLARLSRAWRISERTGASLSDTLGDVAEAVRAERDTGRLVATELSNATATGWLLGLLPFAGLAMGYAFGGDPLGYLTGSAAGLVCLLAGVLLACVGMLWSDRLARRAGAPR